MAVCLAVAVCGCGCGCGCGCVAVWLWMWMWLWLWLWLCVAVAVAVAVAVCGCGCVPLVHSCVRQVRNAERAGAAAVVVLDLHEDAGAAPPAASRTTAMKDDGSGGDVRIPSALLSPSESRALLQALHLRRACVAASATPSSRCGLLRRGILRCPHNATLSAAPLPPSLSFPPDLESILPASSRGESSIEEQVALLQALMAVLGGAAVGGN